MRLRGDKVGKVRGKGVEIEVSMRGEGGDLYIKTSSSTVMMRPLLPNASYNYGRMFTI